MAELYDPNEPKLDPEDIQNLGNLSDAGKILLVNPRSPRTPNIIREFENSGYANPFSALNLALQEDQEKYEGRSLVEILYDRMESPNQAGYVLENYEWKSAEQLLDAVENLSSYVEKVTAGEVRPRRHAEVAQDAEDLDNLVSAWLGFV